MNKVKEYWENRYATGGNSGAGSYNAEAIMKANIINHWIKELEIKTVNEIGCGDGNNLMYYKIPIMFTGYDLSETAVKMCVERVKQRPDYLKFNFTSEWRNQDFEANLCLCLDVWYHLTDDKVFEELCETLFGIGMWKYIIGYTMDTNEQFTTEGVPLAKHLQNREFLSEVAKYPQWEVVAVIGGIKTIDDKVFEFPNGKKFFLLRRKVLEVTNK